MNKKNKRDRSDHIRLKSRTIRPNIKYISNIHCSSILYSIVPYIIAHPNRNSLLILISQYSQILL
ncbi:hypothetical protein DERP_003003 [Dermatophagoides pteronyssinus]|uniref:Uncharacterized protein n=1 Tax=Dermatophagoides pteronyssinus TaxID=6956 RepID=A0ABQ8JWB6_DERPT|nr:hypothetical protein DERP_003003 [Dermatophagoides pteronyssinus]